ncbi:hypothetical protein HK102_005008 [Quaeritorhiza haematococci]|nr:hypothetical protein HK102_005008 [Quaeritorhiza haematococci]
MMGESVADTPSYMNGSTTTSIEPWSEAGKKLKANHPALYAAGTGCFEDLKKLGPERAVTDSAAEEYGNVQEIDKDVRFGIRRGETAITLAAGKNYVEICTWLLANGADPNTPSSNGSTPLHEASFKNATSTLTLLLSHGALSSLHAQDTDGATPLHLAAFTNATAACSILLSAGADLHKKDNNDAAPLHYAAYRNGTETCDLLLSKGADLHATESTGSTPFQLAAGSNALETLKFLLSRGALINSISPVNGGTPLHEAAWRNATQACDFLLSNGADLHARDKNGWTVLHCAAENPEAVEVVEFLVRKGADVNARCGDGSTPVDIARRKGCGAVVDALVRYGAGKED